MKFYIYSYDESSLICLLKIRRKKNSLELSFSFLESSKLELLSINFKFANLLSRFKKFINCTFIFKMAICVILDIG